MLFDRTEHEPEEYDPEAEFRDPDSDSLTIPEVSTETEPDLSVPEVGTEAEPDLSVPEVSTEFDETDVPSELLKHFWALVLVLNGAILAAALSFLFLLFEGSTTRTVASAAVAVVLSVFAYRRYQAYKRLDIHDESETDADAGSEREPTTDSAAGDTSGEPTNATDSSDEPAHDDDRR